MRNTNCGNTSQSGGSLPTGGGIEAWKPYISLISIQNPIVLLQCLAPNGTVQIEIPHTYLNKHSFLTRCEVSLNSDSDRIHVSGSTESRDQARRCSNDFRDPRSSIVGRIHKWRLSPRGLTSFLRLCSRIRNLTWRRSSPEQCVASNRTTRDVGQFNCRQEMVAEASVFIDGDARHPRSSGQFVLSCPGNCCALHFNICIQQISESWRKSRTFRFHVTPFPCSALHPLTVNE